MNPDDLLMKHPLFFAAAVFLRGTPKLKNS